MWTYSGTVAAAGDWLDIRCLGGACGMVPGQMTVGYCLVDTVMGPCGVAWSDRGITHVHLPEALPAETEARIAARAGAPRREPPAWVWAVGERLAARLNGTVDDLDDVPLDLDGIPLFHRAVMIAARGVKHGTTETYGGLGARAGSVGSARAVGQAMARNPVPLLVPCHRVLGAGGAPGGFTAAGGLTAKARLLAAEGVRLRGTVAPPTAEAHDRGLQYDPVAAVETLSRADKRLARVIERAGPLGLSADPGQSAYASLARAIVYQQLAGAAAATIHGRLMALFPGGVLGSPGELLALPDPVLQGVGLSRSKRAALQDLAARTLDGTVPDLDTLRGMDDAAIVERLTRIRGVGRWTVEMMLIFRLGRPDVLPVTDYGVRKGFQKVHGGEALPTEARLTTVGARWRPYRSVASWYLWRALE